MEVLLLGHRAEATDDVEAHARRLGLGLHLQVPRRRGDLDGAPVDLDDGDPPAGTGDVAHRRTRLATQAGLQRDLFGVARLGLDAVGA